jgi:hypothetical protein
VFERAGALEGGDEGAPAYSKNEFGKRGGREQRIRALIDWPWLGRAGAP